MRNTRVINLFAGPGSGKSTSASGLFYFFKNCGISCEVASEYAKDLVWSSRTEMFEQQDYLFAKQNYKIKRLIGKVDWVITDSPLLLGAIYVPENYPDSFKTFVTQMSQRYNNINIFVNRVKPYDPNGRNQKTPEESDVISQRILKLLQYYALPFSTVDGDITAPLKIMQIMGFRLFPDVKEQLIKALTEMP